MELNSLTRPYGLIRGRRVGRGGKRGKTSGRGGKGQTARAGNKPRPEWRDIIKKIPKRRGYGRNRSRTAPPRTPASVVNFEMLSKHFENGSTVTPIALVHKNIVRRISGKVPAVKILAKGVLAKKLIFQGVLISASARSAIEKAGGTIKASEPRS